MTYKTVRQWLIDHTSLEPSLLEGAGFDSLVKERIASCGSGDETAYVTGLDQANDEIDRLTAGIAVPETWLFRYPRSYERLVEHLHRLHVSGSTSLRMVSLGCATGQEPYCMAMCAVHAGWPAERVRIEGIDRNCEFLRSAYSAQFGAASIRTEIPDWAMHFLRRTGEMIGIEPTIHSIVRFKQADVTDSTFTLDDASYDVVFCRNVLIYLNAAARVRLLKIICAAMKPDGLLFVGHAEHLIRCGELLRPVRSPHAFALERTPIESADSKKFTMATTPAPRRTASAPNGAIGRFEPATTPRVNSPSSPPPPKPEETLERALALADAGATDEVESMIRSIIARRGPSASAYELLGMIRMTENDINAAKRSFEQAVYLDPDRVTSLVQLAIISERLGDSRRAGVMWDRARRTESDVTRETRA
jgi:chemotaxis protein methyltransferase WspC